VSVTRPYSCALDASALLALLHEDPGADIVEPLLEDTVISSVIWSEVVQKSPARGVELDGLREDLQALGLVIVPFAVEDAEASARLHDETAEFELSLADRTCLTLSSNLAIPALTADQAWAELATASISSSSDPLTDFGSEPVGLHPRYDRDGLPTFGGSTITSLAAASIPAFQGHPGRLHARPRMSRSSPARC
jgi:ribonuclease VapC